MALGMHPGETPVSRELQNPKGDTCEFRYLQITEQGFGLVWFVGFVFFFKTANLNVCISFSAIVGIRYNLYI